MKAREFLSSLIFIAVPLVCAGPAIAQANQRPHFVPESMAEYAAGYQRNHHQDLDREHADAAKYHAYRVVSSGVSGTVIARSVTIDAAGHLHIVGEPGTVVRGKVASGPGEMHILLPVTVSPPR